ncbi:ATP-binding cassette domain-containing protein [Paenibacillus puerhi]|uniref:ATP-binding cassette domain-containing protein n=1 Tax=Paenibacillus puerhi TaxID=2692622 RepID=UPI00135769AC|nr:ATP-binding cassette domain-containing protein [Paenibacillus puerhi]
MLDAYVLSDISFTIKKGERIAIVGENGSGKSTLIKCLIGLYTPTNGRVKYDGIDLKDVDIMPNISVIFQDFVRYKLTLRENIGISNLDILHEDDMLMEALHKAGGVNLIKKIDGLDSELGTMFNGGRDLSGGEWQKLAISRALFRAC